MPRLKTDIIAEFGDFQTPAPLAARACDLLRSLGIEATAIIEPTCGRGAFLFAAADCWPTARKVIGLDVNAGHLKVARGLAETRGAGGTIELENADFFRVDWTHRLACLPEPLLVIGNPPWVTNSHVSALGGSNVPTKSNFQKHNGLDAITGKANFDISEWMLLQLAGALKGRRGTLAMLVKAVVARKVLQHCWKDRFPIGSASIFQIDAMAHFDAAVDASLLVVTFGAAPAPPRANVYGQLTNEIRPIATIGLGGKSVVADLDAYEQTSHLFGPSPLKWRSGIKHDCSKVMELYRERSAYRNGLGERVELEPDYLFPMLKTSEVANGNVSRCTRWMIVPQKRIGESTAEIEHRAPATWRYLRAHADLLARRGSSIYREKPAFSIFGVGEYSFAPWKLAVSGMYKTLRFVKVGPCAGKPVVLDDVTNFLPCESEEAADLVLAMLDSPAARAFFRAHIFWDAKRPVTVELLSRLNLRALASDLNLLSDFDENFDISESIPVRRRNAPRREDAPTLW